MEQRTNKNKERIYLAPYEHYFKDFNEKRWCNPDQENLSSKDEGDSSRAEFSYSTMQSLQEGFIIIMYSCTYWKLPSGNTIHYDCGIRLILPKDCVLIWYEWYLHSGVRSRTSLLGVHLEDIWLFSYVWTDGSTHITSQSLSRGQKQNGAQAYKLNKLSCEDFLFLGLIILRIALNVLMVHLCWVWIFF